jgi:hypothetical protein
MYRDSLYALTQNVKALVILEDWQVLFNLVVY